MKKVLSTWCMRLPEFEIMYNAGLRMTFVKKEAGTSDIESIGGSSTMDFFDRLNKSIGVPLEYHGRDVKAMDEVSQFIRGTTIVPDYTPLRGMPKSYFHIDDVAYFADEKPRVGLARGESCMKLHSVDVSAHIEALKQERLTRIANINVDSCK